MAYGIISRRRFRLLCFEQATESELRCRWCDDSLTVRHSWSSSWRSHKQLTQKRKPHCSFVHCPNSTRDLAFRLACDAGVIRWWESRLTPKKPESSMLDQSILVGVRKGIGKDWCLANMPRFGVRCFSWPAVLRNKCDRVDRGVSWLSVVGVDCESVMRSTMLLLLQRGHFISLWDFDIVLTICNKKKLSSVLFF